MSSKKEIDEAYSLVRLSLPLMSKYEIPVIPKNFAVWYEYVSGNKDLHKLIDARIKNGEKFTAQFNERLYQECCSCKAEDILKNLRGDLQQLLVTIVGSVGELTGQTDKYESVVSKSLEKLSDDTSAGKINDVVQEIIAETKSIGRFGKEIQTKLKDSTQKLSSMQIELDHSRAEAAIDFLTGIANRKAFDEKLIQLTKEAASLNQNLCLLVIDIDHFKKFNDTFGHIVGDEVLKFTANKIKTILRGTDFLARFGGEEFVAILPRTPLDGAKTVAENIRSSFAITKLKAMATSKEIGTITISIGTALYQHGEESKGFIARADKALYFAKNTGRNKVATELDITKQ
jgi:diguanylate cyclase